MRYVAMAIAMLLDGSVVSAQFEPLERCASKGSSIDECARSEAEPLLLYFDDFEQTAAGWSVQDRQSIGANDKVLGGYCKTSDVILARTYELPIGHHGLRVHGTVHLFDQWNGQRAYLTVDGQPAWLMNHKQCTFGCSAINVAGDESVADAVGLEVDVSVPHSATSVTIAFGTSLTGDPCTASFAIDDVAISVF